MSLSLSELSALVARVSDIYVANHSIERDDDWYLLKLQEELGELVAEHLRSSARKRGGADAATIRRAVEDEAADLLASVLLYAHHNKIDLDAALERKWFQHLIPAPER